MKTFFYKILAIFGMMFAIFQLGKRSGKATLKNEINKQTLEDVKKSKKRQIERANDSIDVVRDRMSKYVRK